LSSSEATAPAVVSAQCRLRCSRVADSSPLAHPCPHNSARIFGPDIVAHLQNGTAPACTRRSMAYGAGTLATLEDHPYELRVAPSRWLGQAGEVVLRWFIPSWRWRLLCEGFPWASRDAAHRSGLGRWLDLPHGGLSLLSLPALLAHSDSGHFRPSCTITADGSSSPENFHARRGLKHEVAALQPATRCRELIGR
jgi:hypothetical protein